MPTKFQKLKDRALDRLNVRPQKRNSWTDDWPRPDVAAPEDIQYLFLLTPPFSGSTAIAKYLAQLPEIGGLADNFEGQRWIPGLRREDRWWPEKYVDYASVRQVWSARIAELRRARPEMKYVLEKSPPHLVRHEQIKETFPNSKFLVNIRNPYANISSIFKRRYQFQDIYDRLEIMEYLADLWRFRANKLREANKKQNYSILTYEEFCADPSKIFELFGLEADGINDQFLVNVKDYDPQPITNFNDSQIGQLSDADIAEITKVLGDDKELLAFFGYELKQA